MDGLISQTKLRLILRYFLLKPLVLCIGFLFLSSPCQAPKHLSDEAADELDHELRAQWIPVRHEKPCGFDTIFEELDPSLWPALPESYEWRIEESRHPPSLFKHELARDHEFDFVTYATDALTRFNFLSRWDGVTHHSFAYTRQNSPLSYTGAREVYPIDPFRYEGVTYMRGHCIDFLDTHGLSKKSVVKSGTVIESISTLDPRNYIPEPPSSYWGKTIRRDLVGQIRCDKGCCYAQYMDYGLTTPYRTTDRTASALPAGIFFVRTDSERRPFVSYNVPWNHSIHEGANETHWTKRLQALQDPEDFFPSPFVYDPQEGEINYKKFPPNNKHYRAIVDKIPKHEVGLGDLPCATDKNYYKIAQQAEYEVKSVTGKVMLVHLLLNDNADPIHIETWLKRLAEHALALHEKDSYGFMIKIKEAITELLRKLQDEPVVDKDGRFRDWLAQLYANDSDEAEKRGRGSSSVFDKDLKTAEAPVATPTSIYLSNLTTQRAERIAGSLHAFLTAEELKKLRITYTLNPNSPQTKGVEGKFRTIGVSTEKLEDLEELEKHILEARSKRRLDFTSSSNASSSSSATSSSTFVEKGKGRKTADTLLFDSYKPTPIDISEFKKPDDATHAVMEEVDKLVREIREKALQKKYKAFSSKWPPLGINSFSEVLIYNSGISTRKLSLTEPKLLELHGISSDYFQDVQDIIRSYSGSLRVVRFLDSMIPISDLPDFFPLLQENRGLRYFDVRQAFSTVTDPIEIYNRIYDLLNENDTLEWLPRFVVIRDELELDSLETHILDDRPETTEVINSQEAFLLISKFVNLLRSSKQ